jgi:hypothetical protein
LALVASGSRILAQLLSSYLLIWAPGTFAIELLTALPLIGVRGPGAWLELLVHGTVAVTCAVGGRMLRIASPAGPVVAAVGVAARAIIGLQSLFWTTLPSDVAPGTRLPLGLLTCANAVFWLIVIRSISRPGARPGSDRGQTQVRPRSDPQR